MKRGKKRDTKRELVGKMWYGIALGGLFLTGCSFGMGLNENYVQKIEKKEETTEAVIEQETKAFTKEEFLNDLLETVMDQEFEKLMEEKLTGREILENLIEDDGFCERVWYDADMEEEDTAEIILQKLNSCESLVLREPPYGDATFSLEGLRLMPNLKTLVINFGVWDDSRIEDFTPILELSQLKQLYFSYGAGDELDLSFLAQMDTITELYLPNCSIADIEFLGEMPQLERLSLYGTAVKDLSMLEKLPKLVELALSGNKEAKHIEVVGTLLQMEELGLQDCGLEDISFLSNLKELRGVNLNYNAITDLTPLAGLTKLERLGAAANQIQDIRPLVGLSNLFDLALDQNQIQDISALSNLSYLNQVGISDNQIEDFSPLEGKEDLMFLSVFGNPYKDLKPVWQVPIFNFSTESELSEEQQEVVENWMKQYRPDIEGYSCIDYVEGDLDKDGMLDVAFVVDGNFNEGEGELAYDNERRLFVLLRQKDGSWKECEDKICIRDKSSGGMRGDPYRGLWMGNGYLIKMCEWGSSMGCTETEGYVYQDGKLELVLEKYVSDSRLENKYEVEIAIYSDGIDREEHYTLVLDENSHIVKMDSVE